MRVHIQLDDGLVAALDQRVGPRRRSAYIQAALAAALDDDQRWDDVEAALGTVADHGHDWDADPAAWVANGRHRDARRVG